MNGYIRVWGDFPPSDPRIAPDRIDPTPAGVFEGPALYSLRTGADNSAFRYYATGSTLIWRRTPLSSERTTVATRPAGDSDTSRLDAAKVRIGVLCIRIFIRKQCYKMASSF